MGRRSPTWICQKVTEKQKCGAVNPSRKRICERCGKKRPPRKPPAHMSALDLPYEYYVRLNGGDHCALCGVEPKLGKKLARDHAHVGVGIPRGILCWRHNLALEMFGDDPALLRAAADYLERPR